MFFKKKIYSDFVDLSIGRVYIKPLNHGIINWVSVKSTISGSSINNNLYYGLMEYKLLQLSNKKIDKLSVDDGNKVREAIKKILVHYGLMKKEEPKEYNQKGFQKNDVEWFNAQEQGQIKKFTG